MTYTGRLKKCYLECYLDCYLKKAPQRGSANPDLLGGSYR